jgi:hypothetical protein
MSASPTSGEERLTFDLRPDLVHLTPTNPARVSPSLVAGNSRSSRLTRDDERGRAVRLLVGSTLDPPFRSTGQGEASDGSSSLALRESARDESCVSFVAAHEMAPTRRPLRSSFAAGGERR